jgi:hypothetical protein
MACLRPKLPKQMLDRPAQSGKDESNSNEVQAARRGLLKAMWQASVAPRFSSKPIDMEDYFSDFGGSFASDGHSAASPPTPTPTHNFRNSLVSSSNLTRSESQYLHGLLQSDDLESIRRASLRLGDKDLFPAAGDPPEKQHKVLVRRDSEVQQGLFLLHEKTTVKPSTLVRRMSNLERRLPDPPEMNPDRNNSITMNGTSWGIDSDDECPEPGKPSKKWNPFADESILAWIDGNEGVEVDDDGNASIPTPTSNPFKILGTSAEEISCHPHVLSPPLMEGLQAFMPESLQEYHYWLKYSLVRDGPSLMTMLKHCRASTYTILAIETTDGFVFGSFTSQPWRLFSKGFYGTTEAFIWRMRRSRAETCKSIVEQVLMESKIDVFPFTSRNRHVQSCSSDRIALGFGEVDDMSPRGEHYGNAIFLNSNLTSGSTSTSETFGNPSLMHSDNRGERFEVANVELWAMTPHADVETAVRNEMNTLFLEEGRHSDKDLSLFEILVGPPS